MEEEYDVTILHPDGSTDAVIIPRGKMIAFDPSQIGKVSGIKIELH